MTEQSDAVVHVLELVVADLLVDRTDTAVVLLNRASDLRDHSDLRDRDLTQPALKKVSGVDLSPAGEQVQEVLFEKHRPESW